MRTADDETVLDHGGVESRAGVEGGEVYADWSAARLLIPLGVAVVLAGVGLIVLLRVGFSADDATLTDDTDAATISEVVEQPAPDPAATAGERALAVAEALGSRAIANQPFAYERPFDVVAEFDRITEGLGEFSLAASVGRLIPDGEFRVVGPVNLDWTLADGTVFSTEGELRLVLVGPEWQIDWDPAVLHAGLTPGDVFVRERVTSPRAPILGAGGFELVGERPVVEVGVVTRDVASIDDLANILAEILSIDGPELAERLKRSPSDAVTPVATQRVADLELLASPLSGLPGVVLTETTATLTPDDAYGRALLGWTGEVTAEILERSPDYFAVGDLVGRSGLQAVYNERLAGLPGFRIRIERRFPLRDGAGQEIPADAEVNVVHLSAPQPPEAVQTTIDNLYQVAAEQALQATGLPSSLVAVRASTGEVLAVANGPGAAVENHALTGQYPPGSIFKVVTAYAALEQGVAADQPVGCPSSLAVDGKEFRNSETKDRGTVSLSDAFAHSCNTSFVELGTAMDAGTLPRVARDLGVGAEYRLGTPAFSGSVPVSDSAVDRAATSFGQGRVLVSPLSMAVMAATVADGTYRPPTLVVGEGAGADGAQALAPVMIASLQEMMGAVVDYGTGQALKGVPGGRVHGKTGTAEFGSGDPPPTHAWFIGYQGDVAFAVVVDGGGFGGSVAAPVAADFLRRAAEQG
ncbi:MAG: penicillin-binding transpeptidase domain-containing protein [Acidimicrobiia bacterium]|nr:penicillin-binding transpeptidase domain-containing protein [Acidimicrobiia bacterium]